VFAKILIAYTAYFYSFIFLHTIY